MGITPIYDLPYPDADDAPNVPFDMKALADRLELLFNRPYIKMYLSDDFDITGSDSYQTVDFTNEGAEDTFGMHSNSVNPDRITPKQPGVYWCYAAGIWEGDAAGGHRRTILNKNGGIVGPVYQTEINADNAQGCAFFNGIHLTFNGTTDYFGLSAAQDAGHNVAIRGAGGASFSTVIGAMWMSF